MVILLTALALLPILVVAIVLPWRMGLWTMEDPLKAARKREAAEREALDDLRRAQALHPSAMPLVQRRPRPKPVVRSKDMAAYRSTAATEAALLEDGALERAVREWASA